MAGTALANDAISFCELSAAVKGAKKMLPHGLEFVFFSSLGFRGLGVQDFGGVSKFCFFGDMLHMICMSIAIMVCLA